jgi:hypothetical protein
MATKVEERVSQRFALWDTDNDGTVDASDFENEAKRILDAVGASADTPRGRAVSDAYAQLWRSLAQAGGVPASGSLTDAQVTAIGQAIFQQGEAGFSETVRPVIRSIADLLDPDGDGKISPAEFRKWMDAIGVDTSSAKESFSAIDTDGDGSLSVDELVHAVRDFHLGKVHHPLLGR